MWGARGPLEPLVCGVDFPKVLTRVGPKSEITRKAIRMPTLDKIEICLTELAVARVRGDAKDLVVSIRGHAVTKE